MKGEKAMKKLIIIAAVMLLASPVLAANINDYTKPYTSDANTLVLLHFDQSVPDTFATDSGPTGHLTTMHQFDISGGIPGVQVAPNPGAFWPQASGVPYTGFDTGGTFYNGGLDVSNHLEVHNDSESLTDNGSKTIDFWVGPRPWTTAHNMFTVMYHTGGQYHVALNNNGGTGSNVSYIWAGLSQSQTDTTFIPMNSWTHVRISIDKDTKALINKMDISFYINGQLSSTAERDIYTGTNPNANIRIGNNHNLYWGSQYYGVMDEFRLYNGALGAPIPEPTTISLIAIAALAFLRRKK